MFRTERDILVIALSFSVPSLLITDLVIAFSFSVPLLLITAPLMPPSTPHGSYRL